MHVDAGTTGAAYVTGWLRGRYGDARELGTVARFRRWHVRPEASAAFDLEVAEDALEQDRVRLREWLETVAEDAAAGPPEPPGGYRVTRLQGVTKATAGFAAERVPAAD